jgi:hypothetical protein
VTGRGDLHFITFCCYQRRALVATVQARNLAAQILGEVPGAPSSFLEGGSWGALSLHPFPPRCIGSVVINPAVLRQVELLKTHRRVPLSQMSSSTFEFLQWL